MNEVHYYDLSSNTAFKCDTMLSNKMQCPTRAAVAIIPDESIEPARSNHSHLCNNHFAIERALNERENIKYIYHDAQGKVASDVDKEYVPSQK